ncbi:MAG: AEC family transporter [Bilifractor sp.]
MVLKLVESLVALLLMGIAGFIAVRSGLVKSEDSKVLSKLVVYLLTPCMLIHACEAEISADERQSFLFALVVSAILQVLMVLLAAFLRRPMHLDAVEETSMVYTNCGNLILPLIQMAYGDQMVYLAIPYQITFNVLLWTHCISRLCGQKKYSLKSVVCNPNIIAIAVGSVMIFCGLHLPEVADSAVGALGNMVGPGSMLVIGMVVAGSSLKTVFSMKRAYLVSLFRLIIFPLVCIGILYVIVHIAGLSLYTDAAEIVLLAAAAPAGSTIPQLSVVYGQDSLKAGAINILSTLLCVLTLPLMVMVFRSII